MAKKEKSADDNDKKNGASNADGKKKTLIIIVAAAVLLAGGGGAAAYFLGWFGGGSEETATEEATKEEGEATKDEEHGGKKKDDKKGHGDKKAKEGEAEGGHGAKKVAVPGAPVFYQLPEFLVNLNTGGSQVSFLKMRVALELVSADDVPMVDAQLPRLQDHFNTYLRELRGSDLSGSAGLYRLKEELLLRANQNLAPVKIKDILINEILVQ